jgi:hypothetical protein
MNQRDQFFITLKSPDKNPYHFSNQLPTQIKLPENYSVGVSSLNIPAYFKKIIKFSHSSSNPILIEKILKHEFSRCILSHHSFLDKVDKFDHTPVPNHPSTRVINLESEQDGEISSYFENFQIPFSHQILLLDMLILIFSKITSEKRERVIEIICQTSDKISLPPPSSPPPSSFFQIVELQFLYVCVDIVFFSIVGEKYERIIFSTCTLPHDSMVKRAQNSVDYFPIEKRLISSIECRVHTEYDISLVPLEDNLFSQIILHFKKN